MNAKTAASPRTVIRGESVSPPCKKPLSVSIDYLSFSVPGGSISGILSECIAFLGIDAPTDRGRGMFGYLSSIDLGGYGILAYGGDHQRGTVLVSINGAGCSRIADFGRVGQWAQSLKARITRIDLAADDHDGKTFTVRKAINAYRRGEFKVGGRPPSSSLHNDMGHGTGNTFYVGTRAGGKLCRVYEKGKALGDKLSRWVRGEVELHAKDRVIPWEVVNDPVRFLAGSFPYFSRMSMIAERIKTIKKATAISIEAVQKWVKEAAGKSINVLLDHFGGDLGGLVFAVRRDGVPKRLRGLWGALQAQGV
jgi:phage replication initiation protein